MKTCHIRGKKESFFLFLFAEKAFPQDMPPFPPSTRQKCSSVPHYWKPATLKECQDFRGRVFLIKKATKAGFDHLQSISKAEITLSSEFEFSFEGNSARLDRCVAAINQGCEKMASIAEEIRVSC